MRGAIFWKRRRPDRSENMRRFTVIVDEITFLSFPFLFFRLFYYWNLKTTLWNALVLLIPSSADGNNGYQSSFVKKPPLHVKNSADRQSYQPLLCVSLPKAKKSLLICFAHIEFGPFSGKMSTFRLDALSPMLLEKIITKVSRCPFIFLKIFSRSKRGVTSVCKRRVGGWASSFKGAGISPSP